MADYSVDEFAKLSPFELKDFLIEIADTYGKLMLNAGRGNPNFLATIPREAFFDWGKFALEESERSFAYLSIGLGGFPMKDGLVGRLYNYLQNHTGVGCEFICKTISYVRDQLGLDADDFVYEMTEGILGIMYPVPDRMLTISEQIVEKYIRKEMVNDYPFHDEIDLFAVEGGTAAMTYLFDTLEENFILRKGDTIGIGVPIFTPYLEIPHLRDFKLVQVNVEAEFEDEWQISHKEMDKLLDPEIKAFFLVNPSNPPSVKMSDARLNYLAKIIESRPDLIVLTDDVYGTFADNFKSIFAICPRNTILVYSYSKYFGSTGWRLGVIATAKENVVDDIIAKHAPATKRVLNERYSSISLTPEKVKFIDRLVAESRCVALNHTAGLSTPAQVQMVLFSLFSLMDYKDNYKEELKHLVRHRQAALYNQLGVKAYEDENSVDYYTIIEVTDVAKQIYGEEFSAWLLTRLKPNEMLFKLAKESGTVLLPASGFGTPDPGVRVSLANLNEMDYVKIGKAVRMVLNEYYEEFKTK